MALYRYSLSSRVHRGSIEGVSAYIGRGQGAAGASDYVAREGEHGDKAPTLWRGLFAPENAPDRFRGQENAAAAWREAAKAERQHNGQVAEHFIINLPRELTLQQNIWLAQDHIRDFTREGRLVQAAIHNDGRDGRNVHLHLLVSTRGLDENGFERLKAQAQADRYMRKREYVEGLREKWEHAINRHLERHGHEGNLDHRSYARQGIDRKPGKHIRRWEGVPEEKFRRAIDNHNRRIAEHNARRQLDRAHTHRHETRNPFAQAPAARQALTQPALTRGPAGGQQPDLAARIIARRLANETPEQRARRVERAAELALRRDKDRERGGWER